MQTRSFVSFITVAAIAAASINACSSKNNGSEPQVNENQDGGGGGDGGLGGFMTPGNGGDGGISTPIPCATGCTVATCTAGGSTTITGVVYDPKGADPVYNVQVYVPSSALPTFSPGASCGSCGDLYPSNVIATAATGTNGSFILKGAPNGTNIPLVIQIGKWRRQYTIPTVAPCVANAAPTLRLPADSSEGDLPDIAISTGGLDSLECLPLRMGISASEYIPGAGTSGHIHIFTGGAPNTSTQGAVTENPTTSPQANTNLWDGPEDLLKNDVVLFSCEGAPTAYLSGSAGPANLMQYVNNGGRVFASHYHFAWLTETDVTPANPFATVTPPLATWSNLTNSAILNDNVSFPTDIVTTLANGNPFPEGVALKAWLGSVDALDSSGKLDVYYARDNSDVTATNTNSQAWAALDPSVASSYPQTTSAPTQYFSFDTPIGTGAGEQCGRFVYSDLHVSGGPGVAAAGVTADYASGSPYFVPEGCATRALTPQEKALEFMLFDLTSCLVPVGTMPMGLQQPQ